MEDLFSLTNLINLITLTGLEIVLGIDNVIFIAILLEPIAANIRKKVRFFGLGLALILRIVMLLGVSWIIKLTFPLFTLYSFDFSGRVLLLILGGLFLVVKSFLELREMLSSEKHNEKDTKLSSKSLLNIILQIIFIDLVLSFDSIITAVGMSPENITIIIIAVLISMVIMLVASNKVSDIIYKYPNIKVIGLVFIALVGVMLISEGIEKPITKSSLYFALFFAGIVEFFNIKITKK